MAARASPKRARGRHSPARPQWPPRDRARGELDSAPGSARFAELHLELGGVELRVGELGIEDDEGAHLGGQGLDHDRRQIVTKVEGRRVDAHPGVGGVPRGVRRSRKSPRKPVSVAAHPRRPVPRLVRRAALRAARRAPRPERAGAPGLLAAGRAGGDPAVGDAGARHAVGARPRGARGRAAPGAGRCRRAGPGGQRGNCIRGRRRRAPAAAGAALGYAGGAAAGHRARRGARLAPRAGAGGGARPAHRPARRRPGAARPPRRARRRRPHRVADRARAAAGRAPAGGGA